STSGDTWDLISTGQNNGEGPGSLLFHKSSGVSPLVLAANGNIGIGISSPAAGLHLKNSDLRIDDGQIQSWGRIVFHPDVDNSGDDSVRFLNSTGAEIARFDTTGYMGIGTSSPVVPLQITNGTDASVGGGGYIVMGATNGVNIVMDNNEIIA